MGNGVKTLDAKQLAEKLGEAIGHDHVLTDQESLVFYSTDFSEEKGRTASVVVRPGSTEEVATVVKLATSAGFAVVPRGGGMSYTLGYVPMKDNSVIVNTARMNGIVEINTEDLYITVETGVTWKQIYDALRDKDYRIPFIGTLSGVVATIGGGLGNNATGIGKGEIADDLIGVEVVLSDGRVIRTGGLATECAIPSLRHFGPDLTGLFVHDAGAFGIKTRATFKLERKPKGIAFASFGFHERHQLIAAMIECGRLGVATELLGFQSYHHEQFATENIPTKEEAKMVLREIMHTSSSKIRGIRNILSILRPGGVRFIRKYPFSLHVVVEGFTQGAADRGIAAIKHIARRNGGTSLPPTIIMGFRANPFQPVRRLIQGMKGACSFPSNCNVPYSRAQEYFAKLGAFFDEHQPVMKELGINYTILYIIVKGMFGSEPIIYWPDRLNPLRMSILDADQKETLGKIPENIAARQTALKMRRAMHTIFREFDGAHFGIGKYYPYPQAHQGNETWQLLGEIKGILDPDDLMNPGALGIPSQDALIHGNS
jgi:D-lactate dehydrogenase (cytochrome)